MPVTHAFTSAESDGGDATLVRPSDWNADHDSTHESDTVDAHDASAISIVDEEFGVENVEDALSLLRLMSEERNASSFPAQPGYGDNKWFYRNDLNLFYYYNGSTWELVGVRACRVTRNAALNVTTSNTAITWDNEVRDDGGFWAVGDPTKLVAPATGWYSIGYNVAHTNSGNDYLITDLLVDGTTVIANKDDINATANTTKNVNVTTSIYLTASQYVEVRIVGQATQALIVGASLNFWIHQVG